MKKLWLLALCALHASASELMMKGLASHKLGDITLARTDTGYAVLKGDTRTEVKPYDIDPLLKQLDKKKLEKFLKEGHGYPEITQFSNGDYRVRLCIRGNGGGEVTGKIFYWAAKGVCWGVLAAGAACGVVIVGKEVGKLTGPAGEAVAKELMTTAVTAPGGPAAPIVAQAVAADPKLKENAALATGTAMVAGVSATVNTIEWISQGAQWLGRALPTP